jgi:hypothetical protein
MRRSLGREIEKHLLDTFHPDLTAAKKQSFREYYRELKKGELAKQPQLSQYVDDKRGYRWVTPAKPDAPPEDPGSTSYTAEETCRGQKLRSPL